MAGGEPFWHGLCCTCGGVFSPQAPPGLSGGWSPSRTKQGAGESRHSTSMQTVLIIDDEDGVRFGIRLALEECGYAVIEATNGRVGLTHLRQTTVPLVVLLDLMMPHM